MPRDPGWHESDVGADVTLPQNAPTAVVGDVAAGSRRVTDLWRTDSIAMTADRLERPLRPTQLSPARTLRTGPSPCSAPTCSLSRTAATRSARPITPSSRTPSPAHQERLPYYRACWGIFQSGTRDFCDLDLPRLHELRRKSALRDTVSTGPSIRVSGVRFPHWLSRSRRGRIASMRPRFALRSTHGRLARRAHCA